ncbi:RHS repeat-associated core domain-containing protein [Paenibacillus harenae]|uniref:RHS repeat-associated protein n=1 Tax=Paenibacillus harenae TaxID=306543 RepID=A0ABT9U5V4_PAEHA|nr:RHS repeat-associated core domain-containing protein [Paenibacillus harenae]MDQ0114627.1 RHS repeat-associated protein [Paenibacillus harenae]
MTKSYTFDVNDRPLSITMEGQTFWYVYNGHGDVVALTDKYGKVAARYEYDAWGLVTRMYNGLGERVREGIGWIGDLGTGNGSPGSTQGPEDESGNTDPDYHPGIGNAAAEGTEGTDVTEVDEAASTVDGELSALLAEVDIEPTDDITTDLVKENPYRYAGYYWDRKTQYYYLQARYYDPRLARFISEDTYEGQIDNPQSLNQYMYAENNPLTYIDPTGHIVDTIADIVFIAIDVVAIAANPMNPWNWASLGADVVGLFTPGVTGLGQIVRGATKTEIKAARSALVKSFKGMSKSEIRGTIQMGKMILDYTTLKEIAKVISGIQVHHLIEKRFAKNLGIKQDDILSTAIDPGTHTKITNKFKRANSVPKF